MAAAAVLHGVASALSKFSKPVFKYCYVADPRKSVEQETETAFAGDTKSHESMDSTPIYWCSSEPSESEKKPMIVHIPASDHVEADPIESEPVENEPVDIETKPTVVNTSSTEPIETEKKPTNIKKPPAINKLPNELLEMILAPHLRLVDSSQLGPPLQCTTKVCHDIRRICFAVTNGLKLKDLLSLHWFKFAGWRKDSMNTPRQKTATRLNTTPLQLSKRFAHVGMDLLHNTNAFVEFKTTSCSFAKDARLFGLQVRTLEVGSRIPRVAMKISMERGDEQVPNKWVRYDEVRVFILELSEIEELGRFLMMQVSERQPCYEGRFLNVSILNDNVPGFCKPAEAFEKLLLGPILSGLGQHVNSVAFEGDVDGECLREQLNSHKTLVERSAEFTTEDWLGPALFLDLLRRQYEAIKGERPERAWEILRRLIQFAITAIISRFSAKETSFVAGTFQRWQVKFMFEMLRVSLCKMASYHFGLALDQSKPGNAWRDHALRALHCWGYALATPLHLTPSELVGWRAQCFNELFRLFVMIKDDYSAELCMRRKALIAFEENPNLTPPENFDVMQATIQSGVQAMIDVRKAHIASREDGQAAWENSRPFRMAFGSSFTEEILKPNYQKYWIGGWHSTGPLVNADEIKFPELSGHLASLAH